MAKGDLKDTGWKICQTAQEVDSGDTAWSNVSNITAEDGNDATVTAQFSNWLMASNFGVSLPTGAEVRGIELRINGDASATSTYIETAGFLNDPTVAPSSSTIVGGFLHVNGTVTTDDWVALGIFQTTEQDHIFGGPNKRWGLNPLNAATLKSLVENSNFAFGFRVYRFSGSATVSIDSIAIKVYYFESADIPDSTGWTSPGSGKEAGTGDAWSNMANAVDENLATSATTPTTTQGNTTKYALVYNFGFAIPTGKTITGIEALVVATSDNGTPQGIWDIQQMVLFEDSDTGSPATIPGNTSETTNQNIGQNSPKGALYINIGDWNNRLDIFARYLDEATVEDAGFGVGIKMHISQGTAGADLWEMYVRVYYGDAAPVKISDWLTPIQTVSVDDIFGAGTAWVNPGNAAAADDTYATITLPGSGSTETLLSELGDQSGLLKGNQAFAALEVMAEMKADTAEAFTQNFALYLDDADDDGNWSFRGFKSPFISALNDLGTTEKTIVLGWVFTSKTARDTFLQYASDDDFAVGLQMNITSSTDKKYCDVLTGRMYYHDFSFPSLFTALKDPATAVGNFGSGNTWTNPGNATTEDGNDATVVLNANEISAGLRVSNFSFGLPAGKEVCGIELIYHAENTNGADKPGIIEIIGSAGTAISKHPYTVSNFFRSNGNGVRIINGNIAEMFHVDISDLLTADVNDVDFGVVVYAHNSAGAASSTFKVDYLAMRLYYQSAGAHSESTPKASSDTLTVGAGTENSSKLRTFLALTSSDTPTLTLIEEADDARTFRAISESDPLTISLNEVAQTLRTFLDLSETDTLTVNLSEIEEAAIFSEIAESDTLTLALIELNSVFDGSGAHSVLVRYDDDVILEIQKDRTTLTIRADRTTMKVGKD